MIWIDTSKIVLIFHIIYWQWICETQKTKDVETETFWDLKFGKVSRLRLFETKKFGGCRDWDFSRPAILKDVETETQTCEGCRDRDQPRLSKSCRDRDFFKSLANHWSAKAYWAMSGPNKVTRCIGHAHWLSVWSLVKIGLPNKLSWVGVGGRLLDQVKIRLNQPSSYAWLEAGAELGNTCE